MNDDLKKNFEFEVQTLSQNFDSSLRVERTDAMVDDNKVLQGSADYRKFVRTLQTYLTNAVSAKDLFNLEPIATRVIDNADFNLKYELVDKSNHVNFATDNQSQADPSILTELKSYFAATGMRVVRDGEQLIEVSMTGAVQEPPEFTSSENNENGNRQRHNRDEDEDEDDDMGNNDDEEIRASDVGGPEPLVTSCCECHCLRKAGWYGHSFGKIAPFVFFRKRLLGR